MKSPFRVTWTIEIEEETPFMAAQEALRIQRDPAAIATQFLVQDLANPFHSPIEVDLDSDGSLSPEDDKTDQMLQAGYLKRIDT